MEYEQYNQIGRYEIFTDYRTVDENNIIEVITKALPFHIINHSRINELLWYEAGKQEIRRTKIYRKDIDVKCVDNVASEITEFKLGFNWGYPIPLVQRGVKDTGVENETEGLALLNECYEAAGQSTVQQKLARFVEITGIGYTFVDVNMDWIDGDSYIRLMALDPRYTFIIKSNYYPDHRPMVGVTYRIDENGMRYVTAFTKDRRFEIHEFQVTNGNVKKTEWASGQRSGERNPLGVIPIIEWIRAYDRMGCFERQIPDMDALNILESDMINASSEQVDCIWHTNDVEFAKDEQGNVIKPKTGDWVQTYTSKSGKTPFITPLSPKYDYNGNLEYALSKRSLILQKCNVPQRNDNSGGSTGVAMSDATGWTSAEAAACKQQLIIEDCKMQEVRAVLQAIKVSPYVDQGSPILKLRPIDVQPSVKRQKNYELNNKVNAMVALLNAGVNGMQVFKTIPLFSDSSQAWIDSKDMVEAIQKQKAEPKKTIDEQRTEDIEVNPERNTQDTSDQNENSPVLDKV